MTEYLSAKGVAALVNRRIEIGMSIYTLSSKLGYSGFQRVKDIELGKAHLSIQKAKLWAEALGLTIGDVIMAEFPDSAHNSSPNVGISIPDNTRFLRLENKIRKMTDKEFDMLVEMADMILRYRNYSE